MEGIEKTFMAMASHQTLSLILKYNWKINLGPLSRVRANTVQSKEVYYS